LIGRQCPLALENLVTFSKVTRHGRSQKILRRAKYDPKSFVNLSIYMEFCLTFYLFPYICRILVHTYLAEYFTHVFVTFQFSLSYDQIMINHDQMIHMSIVFYKKISDAYNIHKSKGLKVSPLAHPNDIYISKQYALPIRQTI